ncbi:hypothetical protein CASFOL_015609 [Castilleja foliolosa]|uniref:BHLH domain-containing protein n=1 Tax=Castilleja foliolosa TaxID=1961234 RepID=A0ABD3DE76_9LAMI
MDPPLVNEVSFTAAANPTSYSLAGLLSFPANGGGLGLRMRGLDGALEESTVTDGGNGGSKRGRDIGNSSGDGAAKLVPAIAANQELNGLNGKRAKVPRTRDENNGPKIEAEANTGPVDTIKPEPPKDYIHVRARRGQATDSHSLAERARREKISERMKILQDLVPGCNKVIGKALVLDEIINYIQSLQHQVEFLSMKLEAVNSTSRVNPSMDDFPLKELAAQAFDTSGLLYGPQTPGEYARGAQVEWLHMQVGNEFDRAT